MFDDQQSNNAAGQPPANLPIGEPEDMFAATDTSTEHEPSAAVPRPTPLAAPAPTTAVGAGMLKPKLSPASPPLEPSVTAPPVSAPSMAKPPAASSAPLVRVAPPVMDETHTVKGPTMAKRLMLGLIGVFVILILVGGGWYLYRVFGARFAATPSTPTFTPTVTPSSPSDTNTFSPAPATNDDAAPLTTQSDDDILFGAVIDADSDNLDSAREASIGTDPANWDTDGDGLSDGDEVIIWKTDPLNPDTDGDSYADGDEIRNGYSPTGAGRLFEPPTETPRQ